MPKLTVALAKGRLAEQAIELFERCGVQGEIECFGLVNIWPNQIFDPPPPGCRADIHSSRCFHSNSAG